MALYESDSDVSNEAKVIKILRSVYKNYTYKKLAKASRFDYEVLNTKNELVGYIEIKCATYDSNRYPSMMINETKTLAADHVKTEKGLPTLIIFSLTDGLYGVTNNTIPFKDSSWRDFNGSNRGYPGDKTEISRFKFQTLKKISDKSHVSI